MFSIQQKVVISCVKNNPAVKKGEAKNAQVHVDGVTKTHDIKIWPRKHLQYRHFCAFIFYILHFITSSWLYMCACNINNTTEMIKDITLHCYQN